MQVAKNYLSVEPDNCLIRVNCWVENKTRLDAVYRGKTAPGRYEIYEYLVFPEPSEPLWVLGQLATGRWMELDPQMEKCIKWIEKHLRWINRRHGTKFAIQPRRLSVHGLCQFGLVGG